MGPLNRWSIGAGIGIFAGMAVLTGFHIAAGDAQSERYSVALDQLMPDHVTLDATVQLTTFDTADMDTFDLPLLLGGSALNYNCGNLSVTDPCTTTSTITDALRLVGGYAPVINDDLTLIVGEYVADDWTDVLQRADTIVVDTGDGPQNVTNEGGVFTVTYVDETASASTNAVWQHGLASIPTGALWLAVGAFSVLVAVVAMATIRPRREPQPSEIVGIEAFDELLADN